MNSYENAAIEYARSVVDGTQVCEWVYVDGEKLSPKYVKLQCAEFVRMWDDKHERYVVDRKLLKRITKVLSGLVMAKGPRVHTSIANALAPFQWFIIVALLCCVHRSDPTKRRYETALLEICRKNGKTFVVAVLFLILFFIEPDFSRFFSVAPDGDLAREIKQAIEPLISVNEEALEGEFKVLRDVIKSKVSQGCLCLRDAFWHCPFCLWPWRHGR